MCQASADGTNKEAFEMGCGEDTGTYNVYVGTNGSRNKPKNPRNISLNKVMPMIYRYKQLYKQP